MILYNKSNLVYTVAFPQFLIFQQFLNFQQNNSAQTSVFIFFTSGHYYFFEKLKIVEKQLCRLNCSYGKVSHILKPPILNLYCEIKGSSLMNYLIKPEKYMYYNFLFKNRNNIEQKRVNEQVLSF